MRGVLLCKHAFLLISCDNLQASKAYNCVYIKDQQLPAPAIHTTLQIVLVGIAAWQIKSGASPWDRAGIFPIFFLGSAELASGLSGL